MARKRAMPPLVFQDQRLGRCSFSARWLFAGLWGLADREGRLEWTPKFIDGHVFPFDSVVLDDLADELVRAGFLSRYPCGDRELAAIDPDWWKVHQSPYNKEPESVLPPQLEGSRSVQPNSGDVNAPRDDPGIAPYSRAPRVKGSGSGSGSGSGDAVLRRRAAIARRREEADALLSFWFELANRTLEPRGNARRTLVEALMVHLVDHPADDIRTMIRWLAQESWWRGRQDGGPDKDLFSKQPISWMRKTKAAEFADRVAQAKEWDSIPRPPSLPGSPTNGLGPWLDGDGHAEWLLRTRDRADSYQQELSPSSLCDAAAADDVRMDPELAVGLLRWLETR